jgi:hypothetical protein
LSEYQDYTAASQQLGRFLDAVYNHKQIHSAPGFPTPSDLEEQWQVTESA